MPVRLRITMLFSGLVMLILCMVCSSIYYFSYQARIKNITTRLTNRAITTARLLEQKEVFDHNLIQKIDSLTTISLKNKVVLAFDYEDRKIYSYSDSPQDTLQIEKEILSNTKLKGNLYFRIGEMEAVAYNYPYNGSGIIVVSAAQDVNGKTALKKLLNILLFSFFLGNVIVLVTGFIFSTRLLRPIKKITSDVEEISAQNLARRIKTGSAKDEWYQLADTLNQLLNRLQESFEFQRRFISNASHELSTPLTAISSQMEVTLQRNRSQEEYKQVMKSVYQDVQHMAKLTQTLLEFAKASGSAGGLEINLIRIDEVVLRLPSEISNVNKQFRASVQFGDLPSEEDRLLVFGNELLLLMAIKNIVLNGCKYSEDHHAEIYLTVQEGNICITVTDKGKGIPDTDLVNIFQPFYRLQQNSDADGFGLGLSLASRIITMHKGVIEVNSVVNAGSSFMIILPTAGKLA